MDQKTISFIGGGNMARSLAGGLIANGWDPTQITISDPEPEQRQALAQSLGVATSDDNRSAASGCQVLVLAVKPQVLRAVAHELMPVLQDHHPLIISIAAGVRIADLQRWLGGGQTIVRVMPNTPALVGSGATGMVANAQVSDAERDSAESIMRSVGVTVWLQQEDQLDIVTALSGSGPAYFFLFMEALEQAAVAQGLGRDTARLLTLETAFGAAKMALESGEDPALLRQRVTSPGGTTEKALEVFGQGDLTQLVERAVSAASERSRELAKLLGGK